MKYSAYPRYKPSGVPWFGELPEHWEAERMKTLARCWVSNVDKVPADDEFPVRLCNYTDVYYNHQISPDMGLMESTATAEEIRRFGLRVGDVLITKDSEDWRDIAVPALVVETAPDLVCGYHLAVVRPNEERLLGRYLLRAFQSCTINQQFQSAASGVTRYSLAKSAICGARLPLPPSDEQRFIVDFLDANIEKLDSLLAKKRTLIERLKVERNALISRTVTRGLPPEAARAAGLDPCPKLKPSGVEWLGDVPEHWEVPPLYLRYEVALGKMLHEARITGQHSVQYIRNVDVQWDNINLNDLPEMDISPEERTRYTIRAGDLVVCEGGEVGRCAIVSKLGDDFGYQKALHRMRPLSEAEVPRFMFYTFCWACRCGIFVSEGNPNTIAHLTAERLRRYRFPTPSRSEQQAIADFLDVETAKIDQMAAKVGAAVERLQEYRSALITAAVTGKIDVRGAAR